MKSITSKRTREKGEEEPNHKVKIDTIRMGFPRFSFEERTTSLRMGEIG